jgi:hypothetical protein
VSSNQVILNKKAFLDQDPHETIFTTAAITVDEAENEGESWQPPILEIEATFCIGMDGGGSTLQLFSGGLADDLEGCMDELDTHRSVIDQLILTLAEYRAGLLEAEKWLKERSSDPTT